MMEVAEDTLSKSPELTVSIVPLTYTKFKDAEEFHSMLACASQHGSLLRGYELGVPVKERGFFVCFLSSPLVVNETCLSQHHFGVAACMRPSLLVCMCAPDWISRDQNFCIYGCISKLFGTIVFLNE